MLNKQDSQTSLMLGTLAPWCPEQMFQARAKMSWPYCLDRKGLCPVCHSDNGSVWELPDSRVILGSAQGCRAQLLTPWVRRLKWRKRHRNVTTGSWVHGGQEWTQHVWKVLGVCVAMCDFTVSLDVNTQLTHFAQCSLLHQQTLPEAAQRRHEIIV